MDIPQSVWDEMDHPENKYNFKQTIAAPGRIIVRPKLQETMTESGLHVPAHENRREVIGTVVSVGDPIVTPTGAVHDMTFHGRRAEPGDVVAWSHNTGIQLGDPRNHQVYLEIHHFSDITMLLPEGTLN